MKNKSLGDTLRAMAAPTIQRPAEVVNYTAPEMIDDISEEMLSEQNERFLKHYDDAPDDAKKVADSMKELTALSSDELKARAAKVAKDRLSKTRSEYINSILAKLHPKNAIAAFDQHFMQDDKPVSSWKSKVVKEDELDEGVVVPFKRPGMPINNHSVKPAGVSTVSHTQATSSWAHKIKPADGHSVTTNHAYKSYSDHMSNHGHTPAHPDAFHKAMTNNGFMKQKIAGQHRYVGIKLHEETEMKLNEALESTLAFIKRDRASFKNNFPNNKEMHNMKEKDYNDYITVAKHLERGDINSANKHLSKMDTIPRRDMITHLEDNGYTQKGTEMKVEKLKESDNPVERLAAKIRVRDPYIEESHKINDKVKIVGGPKDVVGKSGVIGEVNRSAGKSKKYTIDYDHDGKGNKRSVSLESKHIRALKESFDSLTSSGLSEKEAVNVLVANIISDFPLNEGKTEPGHHLRCAMDDIHNHLMHKIDTEGMAKTIKGGHTQLYNTVIDRLNDMHRFETNGKHYDPETKKIYHPEHRGLGSAQGYSY